MISSIKTYDENGIEILSRSTEQNEIENPETGDWEIRYETTKKERNSKYPYVVQVRTSSKTNKNGQMTEPIKENGTYAIDLQAMESLDYSKDNVIEDIPKYFKQNQSQITNAMQPDLKGVNLRIATQIKEGLRKMGYRANLPGFEEKQEENIQK